VQPTIVSPQSDQEIDLIEAVLRSITPPAISIGASSVEIQEVFNKLSLQQNEDELLTRICRSYKLPPLALTGSHAGVAAAEVMTLWGKTYSIAPSTATPWIPIGKVGMIPVMGHYLPSSRDFWGIPRDLVIRVYLKKRDYQRVCSVSLKTTYGEGHPRPPALESTQPKTVVRYLQASNLLDEKSTATPAEQVWEKLQKDPEILQALKAVTEKIPTLPLTGLMIPRTTSELVPQSICKRIPAMCYYSAGNTYWVLTPRTDQENSIEDEINSLNREGGLKKVIAAYATESSVRNLLEKIRGQEVADLSGESVVVTEDHSAMNIDPSVFSSIGPNNFPQDPTGALKWIVYKAVVMGSSDIHIQESNGITLVRLRTNGVLSEVARLPLDRLAALLSIVKQHAGINIADKRNPYDGRFPIRMGTRSVDARVSVIPYKEEQSMVIRLIASAEHLLTIDSLKLTPRQSRVVDEAVSRSFGLITVTGPTGSGKSTTLYAILQKRNKPGISISTMEDPVEVHLDGLKQAQINPNIGLDFAKLFPYELRHDPDVIFVGEIRDKATADAALRAAMTGHLVLTTLHANDALSAIDRLLDLGAERSLIAATMTLMQAQRLVGAICSSCAQAIDTPLDIAREYEKAELRIPPRVYRPVGCGACNNTGYSGQIAIMELIPVTAKIRGLIQRGALYDEMNQAAKAEINFKDLFQEGLRKVAEGLTSYEEITPYRPPYENFDWSDD